MFKSRSRSPHAVATTINDEFIHQILQELHCENTSEALLKVRDLKVFQKKHQKEKKLIVNLQKLVKDCINQEGIGMLTNPSIPDIYSD